MTRERALTLPAEDWRSRSPEFKDPKLAQNLALAERLTAIGKRHGRSAGEVAIAWALRLPSVTGAIVGARSPEQVDGIVGGATFELSDQELAEIEGPGQPVEGSSARRSANRVRERLRLRCSSVGLRFSLIGFRRARKHAVSCVVLLRWQKSHIMLHNNYCYYCGFC